MWRGCTDYGSRPIEKIASTKIAVRTEALFGSIFLKASLACQPTSQDGQFAAAPPNPCQRQWPPRDVSPVAVVHDGGIRALQTLRLAHDFAHALCRCVEPILFLANTVSLPLSV